MQVSREMDKAVADNKQAERSIMELEKVYVYACM